MTGSFNVPQRLAGAEGHVMYDMKVAVRPTDGAAFIVGSTTGKVWFGPLGGVPVRDIHGNSGDNASQWPTLAFANDGTGFVGWRAGDKWNNWIQVVPPGWNGGALAAPMNVSPAMCAASGARNATQIDLAASRKTGKLYAAAFFDFGDYATTGFVESSDGGRTWGSYKELARDNTRSNQSPRIEVGKDTDNVHIIVRNGNNLAAVSRVGGVWDATPQILMSSNDPGWDIRSQDGKNIKAITEAKSGTAVAAWKNPATKSVAVALRKPGQPWKIVTRSLPVGSPQTVDLDAPPNGEVYMLVQSENPPFGTHLLVLPPVNDGFGPETILPIKVEPNWGMAGCGIDASGYGGKIWMAWCNGNPLPQQTYFTSGIYDGSIPIAPPVTTPPPVVVAPPPPVVTPPLPPVNEFLPPSSVSVEPTSFNQVTIYWKDKTSDEVEFSVERKEAGVDWRIVGSAAANSTKWLDVIGIQPSTQYWYRVRAHKTGLYSNYSAEVATVTPAKPIDPPPPPPKPVEPPPVPANPNVIDKGGFRLGYGMLDYWKKFDIIGVPHPLGLPKSNEFDYVAPDGKKFVVQVFERVILGYDATITDPRYRVQGMQIGRDWMLKHLAKQS